MNWQRVTTWCMARTWSIPLWALLLGILALALIVCGVGYLAGNYRVWVDENGG